MICDVPDAILIDVDVTRQGDCNEFLKSLSEEERRASLLTLAASPWRNLLASDVDQSLITMTGFDGVSFTSLLQKFAPLFDDYTPFHTSHILLKQDPSKGGRPRMACLEDCLGLVLVWTRKRGSVTALQLIFGMACSNLCMYLRFGRRVIVEALKSDALAMIVIPSEEIIVSYQEAVGAIYPLLSDVWSTMDRLKLYLQQSGNTEIQARYYNGWTNGHYMTSIFVFCPDWTIPIAFFNVQGSVHDSQVAHWGRVYDKLGAVYDDTVGNLPKGYIRNVPLPRVPRDQSTFQSRVPPVHTIYNTSLLRGSAFISYVQ